MYFMNDTLAYQLSDFDNDTTTLDTFYKVKMVFVGNDSKLLPLDKDKMVHNYFLAHTPGGRPNVPLFKGFSDEVIWAAFGAYMLSLIDYRGTHYKKILIS